MWRCITVRATIDQPVDRVFAHLADPSTWHRFAPAVVSRRRIGEAPLTIGTRWMAVDRIGPFKFSFIDELAAYELDRRVVWLSSAPWNARTEYVCSPDGVATRIIATYEGDVGGWLRAMGVVPPTLIGWYLSHDFRRLGALLAADAAAPSRLPEPG